MSDRSGSRGRFGAVGRFGARTAYLTSTFLPHTPLAIDVAAARHLLTDRRAQARVQVGSRLVAATGILK
jgi:hypothetical protein